MSKPYKEGAGWAYRLRVAGQDVYRSGFKSEPQARRDQDKIKAELTEGPAQAGLGPHRTSVGVAFLDYARQRLPYLKGADQDSRRINRYLRALRLPVVKLTPVELEKDGKRVYWDVTFQEEGVRTMPASLMAHRAHQGQESEVSERVRKHLATMKMSEVTTHHIQPLINALRSEGKKSATIHLERSELRRLFKHASAVWKWRRAGGNPAGLELDMPPIDAGRDRVLTNEEWQRISKELVNYGNPYVAPLACLMLETTMRSGEELTVMRWGHVNWKERVLDLPDAKNGTRKVPLGPGALHVLLQMKKHAPTPPQPHDRVFLTTYQAAKKAWAVARDRAGVEDIKLHDLRHTSTTRFSIEFDGNMAVLMVITGHKTPKMLIRYVNLKAREVATLMHKEALDVNHTAAGYKMNVSDAWDRGLEAKAQRAQEASLRGGKRPSRALSAPALQGESKRVVEAVKAAEAPESMSTQPIPMQAAVRSNVIKVDFGRRAA